MLLDVKQRWKTYFDQREQTLDAAEAEERDFHDCILSFIASADATLARM